MCGKAVFGGVIGEGRSPTLYLVKMGLRQVLVGHRQIELKAMNAGRVQGSGKLWSVRVKALQ